MDKRNAAFVTVFVATLPFLIFVLAKGLAGKGEPTNALSAPDDYMLAFGVGITVLAATIAARRKVQITRLFCQSVVLMLISACCYVAMTISIENHLSLNAWYAGMVIISMVGSAIVAWQYVKAAI